MSSPATVTTGEDWTLPIQLMENGVPVNLTGLTVRAAIVSLAGDLIAGPVTADPDHDDADLVNGVAVPVFPRALTESALANGTLVPGQVQIEVVRVNGLVEDTWRRQLLWVVKGAIP